MDTATRSAMDERAVAGVVRDYFESWFEGDAERMKRSLHPKLAKRALLAGSFAAGNRDVGEADPLDEDTAQTMVAGVSTSNDPSMRYVPLALVTETLGVVRTAEAADRLSAAAGLAIDTTRAAAAAAAQAFRIFSNVVIAVSLPTSMVTWVRT